MTHLIEEAFSSILDTRIRELRVAETARMAVFGVGLQAFRDGVFFALWMRGYGNGSP